MPIEVAEHPFAIDAVDADEQTDISFYILDPITYCGALMGTMQKLERGLFKQTAPAAVDYQGIIINNLVLQPEK
jgi:hypothetical protein